LLGEIPASLLVFNVTVWRETPLLVSFYSFSSLFNNGRRRKQQTFTSCFSKVQELHQLFVWPSLQRQLDHEQRRRPTSIGQQWQCGQPHFGGAGGILFDEVHIYESLLLADLNFSFKANCFIVLFILCTQILTMDC